MIRGVYLNGPVDDYSECIRIREITAQETGISPAESDDTMAVHILLYDEEEQPVTAAGMAFGFDGVFQITYMATLAGRRCRGYGTFVMHMLLDKVHMAGAERLQVRCSERFAGLFREFGFMEKAEDMYELDIRAYYASRKCCH